MKNKILCSEHTSLSIRMVGRTHKCKSFTQDNNESEGICKNYLLCQVLKTALKGEIVSEPELGQIICPHFYENIWKLKYTEFSEDDLRINYPECLD